jgi:hypothetical protein
VRSVPFDLDVLLPTQLGRRRADLPERKLMAAVLEKALDELQSGRIVEPREGPRWRPPLVYVPARVWLASEDTTWPYAFVNICHALGLDPQAVRRRVAVLEGQASAQRPRQVGARRVLGMPTGGWRSREAAGGEA